MIFLPFDMKGGSEKLHAWNIIVEDCISFHNKGQKEFTVLHTFLYGKESGSDQYKEKQNISSWVSVLKKMFEIYVV